jgi:DNA-binding NtrC family response regulator
VTPSGEDSFCQLSSPLFQMSIERRKAFSLLREPRGALLVEDDDLCRILIKKLLEDKGFRVDAVATAEEAICLLKEKIFIVAFVDLLLPGMNGIEFIQHCYKHYPHLPCVVVSGAPEFFHLLDDLRVFMVIKKPFEIRHLNELLVKLNLEAAG